MTNQQKIGLGIIATLLFLNISAWQYVFVLSGPHYLKVAALDVGQGDSIFIETPGMRHILIDGGPGQAVLAPLAKELPFWEKHLDVVILTHPDSDHLEGLLAVLQKYQMDYIVWTGIICGGTQYQQWLTLLAQAKAHGTKIIIAKAGDSIENGQAHLDILHPFTNISGQDFRPDNNDNDTGIVSHLVYGKNSFLFTADISDVVEQEMLSANSSVASDVLKVAHHGSRFSSSENFLRAVAPSLAVISVGAHNTYGHPTPQTLQALQKFGIKTLRTDQNGTVQILSDGEHLKINQ